MKQLTICTHKYIQLLEDFAARVKDSSPLTIRRCGEIIDGRFSVDCLINPTDLIFIQELMALLTDIALRENPVYKHSPKLRLLAEDLRTTALYHSLIGGLIRFLKHSRDLHLEGYVAFRMTEYRHKLDILSYSLIKKMKLIQQD